MRRLLVILAALTLGPAAALADEAGTALMASARAWEAQQRPDLARLALEKLLLSEPDNTDAALRLGLLELRSARMDRVREIIADLQARHPDDPATRELADSYRIATSDRLKMATVQRLMQIGKDREAIAALGELFPQGPPTGELGLEYFRITGSLDEQWPRARAGLEQLAAQHPDDPRYALALAKLLGRRDSTRAEALRRLAALAQRDDVDRKQVQEARSSLLRRLPETAASGAAMQEYLKTAPDDAAMRQRVAQLQAARRERERRAYDPELRKLALGQAALDRGELAVAQPLLESAAAQRPREGDAAGALGLLRLRQSRHAEAIELFGRAAKLAPGNRSKWLSLQRTARYWGALGQSETARDHGRLVEAERTVRDALALDPQQPDGLALLAGIRARQGATAEAETLYRQALQRDADNGAAIRGLLQLLEETGRRPQAAELAERLGHASKGDAARFAQIRAGILRDEADAALAAGRDGEALRLLEQAQELAPADPWIRFDLAKLYRRFGLARMARELMEEGVARAPQDPQARYADALLLSSLDDDDAALQALLPIPANERSEGMQSLARRLRVVLARARAEAAVAAGDGPGARTQLQAAAVDAGDDPKLRADLASGWIALGERERARREMRDWARTQPDSAAVSLATAQVLARAGADDELGTALAGLRARRDLDVEQAQELARLDAAWSQRHGEALGQRGEYAAALQVLGAARARAPQDRDLLAAQARVLLDSGGAAQARTLFDAAVLARPDDAQLRLAYAQFLMRAAQAQLRGAALREAARSQLDAALALAGRDDRDLMFDIAEARAELGDRRDAEALAHSLVDAQPGDASLLIAAGRVERAAGQDAAAVAYFEQAQAAAAPHGSPRADAELRRMDERWDDFVATAGYYSNKPGDAGISSYSALAIPVELRRPLLHRAELFAHVDEVRADAGTLPGDFAASALYGTVQAAGPGAVDAFAGGVGQSASGVDVGIGVQDAHWRADVGTTPIGFPVTDVVGGLRYNSSLGALGWSANLARRPVTSSLLSYAGARDPVSGATWGGVRSTGLELRSSLDLDAWNASVAGAYYRYDGRNVLANDELALRLAGDHLFVDAPDLRVEAGLALSYWAYAENQRYYSFGHGGYYSPQSYVSLGAPIDATGRYGRLAWRLRGALSFSRSREDAAPFYPTDPALQARAGSEPLPRGYAQPQYDGGSGTGFGRALSGSVEYAFWPQLFGGAAFDIDRSAYYAPNLFTLYLRYAFRALVGPVDFPPRPAKAYSQY